jgi:hypothetical protein
MTSEPTVPVAPVIKIMSSGPLLEIGFLGELGVDAAPAGRAPPRDDAVGQLTSFGVHEHQIDCSAQPAATGTAAALAAAASPMLAAFECSWHSPWAARPSIGAAIQTSQLSLLL